MVFPRVLANGVPESPSVNIQTLPDELLQSCFGFVCLEYQGKHDAVSLRTLNSVNRRWRRAAFDHCPLWTHIPTIDLSRKGSQGNVTGKAELVKQYLHQSGALPISFRFIAADDGKWKKILELLIGQCRRWENIDITVPNLLFYDILSSVRVCLPLLTTLALRITFNATRDRAIEKVDIFADTPKLRTVTYYTNLGVLAATDRPLVLEVPFLQLEHFTLLEQSFGTGYYAHLLGDVLPVALKTLEYTVNIFSPHVLPSPKQLGFPHLEILKLHSVAFNETDLPSHLGHFVLPSLTHLEIKGAVDPGIGEGMYGAIRDLIRRSGCSLKCLAFPSSRSDGHILHEIISLCPNLVELGMSVANYATFVPLIFDPSSTFPALPHLKTLVISDIDLAGGAPRLYFPGDYAGALARVIKSRTPSWNRKAPVQVLETFTFRSESAAALHFGLLDDISFRRFDDGLSSPFLPPAKQEVPNFWLCYAMLMRHLPVKTWMNVTLMKSMHGMLQTLEKLKLEECDTHYLMRNGVVKFLRLLGEKPDGCTPGDLIFRFRARARKLCAKWKPFILRDAKVYWWGSPEPGVIRLRFTTPDNRDRITDEDKWNEIVGFNDAMPSGA